MPEVPDAGPRANARTAPRTLACVLFVAALVPSWLGLLGSWHWLLDLASHFRWQYLAAGCAAMAWSWWRRQRLVLEFAVLTTLVNGALVAGLAQAPHVLTDPPLAGHIPLRVLSFNVLNSNQRRQDVVDYIAAVDADIVFLAEVDARWAAALEPLASRYPHRVVHPRPDRFGLALLSRVPLEDPQVLEPGGASLPSASAHLMHEGRRLLFVGMHPPPPLDARRAHMRDRQLAALAGMAAGRSGPMVVAGDFNATPWSAPVRNLFAHGLAFRGTSAFWAPTWLSRSPLAIPIDLALCTEPLVITRRERGPSLGSDHRPVLFEVRWQDGPADGTS